MTLRVLSGSGTGWQRSKVVKQLLSVSGASDTNSIAVSLLSFGNEVGFRAPLQPFSLAE
jgi:hypothetical protein